MPGSRPGIRLLANTPAKQSTQGRPALMTGADADHGRQADMAVGPEFTSIIHS